MSQENPRKRVLFTLGICMAGLLILLLIALGNARRQSDAMGETAAKPRKEIPIVTVNGTDIYQARIDAIRDQFDLSRFPDEDALIQYVIQSQLLSDRAKALKLNEQSEIKTQLEIARNNILSEAAINDHIAREVTEENIKAFYEAEKSEKNPDLQIKARHIVVSDAAKAKEVRRQLDEGESFAALAMKFSTDRASRESGGDLGYISRDMLETTLSKTIFSAQKNAVLDAFETPQGWHVVEVQDRRLAPVPSFDSRKGAIKALLTAKAVEALLNDMEKSAKITYHETPKALRPAPIEQ